MLLVPLEVSAIIDVIEEANVNFDSFSSILLGNHKVIKAMKMFKEPKRQSSPQPMTKTQAAPD